MMIYEVSSQVEVNSYFVLTVLLTVCSNIFGHPGDLLLEHETTPMHQWLHVHIFTMQGQRTRHQHYSERTGTVIRAPSTRSWVPYLGGLDVGVYGRPIQRKAFEGGRGAREGPTKHPFGLACCVLRASELSSVVRCKLTPRAIVKVSSFGRRDATCTTI